MSGLISDDYTVALRGDIAAIFIPGCGVMGHEEAHRIIAALTKFYGENTPADIEEMNRPMPDLSGYVYLLKYQHLYKIGMSRFGGQYRAAQIRDKRKLPAKPELIFEIAVPDMAAKEKELHIRFADRRVKGEWFALTPEDVAYIKSLGGAS